MTLQHPPPSSGARVVNPQQLLRQNLIPTKGTKVLFTYWTSTRLCATQCFLIDFPEDSLCLT
jgi:hypothetical protein